MLNKKPKVGEQVFTSGGDYKKITKIIDKDTVLLNDCIACHINTLQSFEDFVLEHRAKIEKVLKAKED